MAGSDRARAGTQGRDGPTGARGRGRLYRPARDVSRRRAAIE